MRRRSLITFKAGNHIRRRRCLRVEATLIRYWAKGLESLWGRDGESRRLVLESVSSTSTASRKTSATSSTTSIIESTTIIRATTRTATKLGIAETHVLHILFDFPLGFYTLSVNFPLSDSFTFACVHLLSGENDSIASSTRMAETKAEILYLPLVISS